LQLAADPVADLRPDGVEIKVNGVETYSESHQKRSSRKTGTLSDMAVDGLLHAWQLRAPLVGGLA
jgi:hypothetical protein